FPVAFQDRDGLAWQNISCPADLPRSFSGHYTHPTERGLGEGGWLSPRSSPARRRNALRISPLPPLRYGFARILQKETRSMSGRTATIGSGLIGRAWAIAFARSGCEVRLWDPAEEAAVRAPRDYRGAAGGSREQRDAERACSRGSVEPHHERAQPGRRDGGRELGSGECGGKAGGQEGALEGDGAPRAPIGHTGQLHLRHRAVTLHRRAEKPRALPYRPSDQSSLPGPGR